MFGQWDERDPTSGDGFTVIFNKVKEEKQIAASKFPIVPNQPTNLPNTQTKDARSKVFVQFKIHMLSLASNSNMGHDLKSNKVVFSA